MSIPLATRNLNQDFYVHMLGSIYRSGYRIYDPDYATSKEPDIYEKVRRDPIIAQAIDTRLHGVAGRQWRCAPGSDTPVDKLVAKMMEESFREISHFSEARREAAQAVIRGQSWLYIEGERRLLSLAGTAPREWWIPTKLKDVDRRRFRLVPKWTGEGKPADRDLKVQWEMFSVKELVWKTLENPEYFIKVTYNDEEARLGYGRGLLEAIYFYHWIKGEILKEGLHGVKKWARGKMVAKIDGLRAGSAAGSTEGDASNTAIQNQWLEALQRMEEENILAVSKEDDVEVIESTGTGHQIVMDLIRYLDGAIRSVILGSNLPFGGGEDVGSNARAETELNVHEALIQFDREKVDEDITHDLGGLWLRQNVANFRELGLGGARKPRFETMQEKREDPERNANVVATATNAGIDLRKDEVYQKLGFTPPQEGDDVIKGRTPSANPFGTPFDTGEFDRSMPDEKTAAMARVMIKAGVRPDDAVRCAVEAGKASGPAQAIPPAPPPPSITLNNPVTVQAPAASPAPAAGPVTVVSPIHIPERIMLEAMRQPDINIPAPIVNVPAPVVNVPAPIVNVEAPKVDVHVSAPNVTMPDIRVEPKIEVTALMPKDLKFELSLPPVRKTIDFTKDKNGAITGAEVKTA